MAKTLIEQLEERKSALSVKELAEMMNVSPDAIYLELKKGKLASFRIGTSVRFDPKTTTDWLRKASA